MTDPVLSLETIVHEVRERLPLLKDGVALNHAGIAPQPVFLSLSQFERARAQRLPLEALATMGGARPRIRDLYAELLNVAPNEIAITKNTAEGVNFIAQGYPWKKRDEILTVSVEYPSNVYPWWNLKDRGVVVRIVQERAGRVDYAELEAAITPRTRMLALSHVEFASGFAFDIPRLVELSRRHGLFLFLDIAQSIGVIDVNLDGVDAAAWPTWKWLMGPLGMGGFFLAKRHLETIRPAFVGSDGMVPTADYLDYNFAFRPDASRFEYSTENLAGLIGVQAALETIVPVIPAIPSRVFENGDAVVSLLAPRGFELYSSQVAGERSGILSFIVPGSGPDAGAAVMQKLKIARVEAALRAGRLRVSPHFYNTASDLERLRAALA